MITIPQQPTVPSGIHGDTLSSHPLNSHSNTEMTFAPLESCESGSSPSNSSPISLNGKGGRASSGTGSEEDIEDVRSDFDDLGVTDDVDVFEGQGVRNTANSDEKRKQHKRGLSMEKLLGGKSSNSGKNGALGGTSQSLKEDSSITPLSAKEKGKMVRSDAAAPLANGSTTSATARHEKSFTSESSSSSKKKVDAVIILKEERASIFQDFLKFVYPQ